jgi:hypothetical protein
MAAAMTVDVTKKELSLVAFVFILAGVYVHYFTDWFKSRPIRIEHSIRPNLALLSNRQGERASTSQTAYIVSFALDREYKLTSVKVVAVSEVATNPDARPLWHLISDSKPVPTRGMAYGEPIAGMKPAASGAVPEPLKPNVDYRLLLEAGRRKGQRDFKCVAANLRGR